MPAGRSTFNKRQKEQQRQQKQRDKAERRIQRKSEEPQAEVDEMAELRRLAEGIEPEEVERVQAGLKSSLIMQEESTSSRAGSLASDWYYLGRVRSFDEIKAGIDSLTPKRILEHVRRYPAKDFTIVTLGAQALTVKV